MRVCTLPKPIGHCNGFLLPLLQCCLLQCCLVILLPHHGLKSQPLPDLRFEHLARAQGLSNSDITCFAQDNDGFLWIGTQAGLNRYDGHEVKIYRHKPSDSTSLTDNHISALYVDREGTLWVGTENNGLSLYLKEQDRFQSFEYSPQDPHSLSYHYVTHIMETADGQLWVATLRGLNRWLPGSGQFERYFRQDNFSITPTTLDSLARQSHPAAILQALEPLKGQGFATWPALVQEARAHVGARQWESLSATLFRYVDHEPGGAYIRALEADAEGGLWIGFEREGLAYFRPGNTTQGGTPDTTLVHHYRHNPEDPKSLAHNEVYSLCLDGPWLWVGTRGGGLNRLNMGQGTFQRYAHPSLASHIKDVLRDADGRIWAADDLGLTLFDARNNSFARYQHQVDQPHSLSASLVNSLFQDQQGNLWVGCLQGGVNLHIPHQPFKNMQPLPGNPQSLTKGQVTALLNDSQGQLLVGYYQTGIDVFSADRTRRTHIQYKPEDPNGLGEGTVFSIFEDRQGNIWVGTYKGGLQRYHPETQSFTSYRHQPGTHHSISGNDVRDIAEDSQGRLWVAIHGGGVNSFDPLTGRFTHWRTDRNRWQSSLSDDWVFCLQTNRQGRVVVGSVGGISIINPQNGTVKSYNNRNTNLAHNRVRSLLHDSQGRLWVGTENSLSLWQEETEQFVNYTQDDGLPNSFIDGIEEDPTGMLWISTNDGLVRFNPTQGSFEHYTVRDGLQGPEFFPGASTHNTSGTLYFGGQQGITYFTPANIIPNRFVPPVHLTSFKLFNKEVPIGSPGSPLQHHVGATPSITLKHYQNFISFGFVALNYVRPEKNSYMYRLEGLEKEWNQVGNQNSASYTSLSPGTYTFRVRGANNDGLWNPQEATVEVQILPPLWRSTGAYVLYALLGLLGLYLFRRMSIGRERLKSSLALARVEAEKERELDRMKLKFFANVSHEFRTPLTLLLGPLEKLLAEDQRQAPANGQGPQSPEKATEQATERHRLHRLMERNGQRLLRLINQLLDLSELEAGFMALHVGQANLNEFARTVLDAFDYRAAHKGIVVEFSAFPTDRPAWFDADKLEKVLYNLLSNAFKFTPQGGAIRLSITLSSPTPGHHIPPHLVGPGMEGQLFAELVVEDSGPGIAADVLNKIFDRFYQVSDSAYKNPGTGIGLALTRELVERHYGHISVESQPGQGTRFIVWLPISRERYTSEELAQAPIDLAQRMASIKNMDRYAHEEAPGPLPPIPSTANTPEAPAEAEEPGTMADEKPLLLVVEDHDDIREYIRLQTQDYYRVEEAANGEEGLQKALALMPDLVVSDVMMPKVDGLQLCKAIKADHRTSHIPIILLTARSSEQYTIQGLATGADDYITKPFSMPVLKARMQNLLDTRRRLQVYYSQQLNGQSLPLASTLPQAQATGAEEAFLAKARNYVEEHLTDDGLNPERLAHALLMSRAQLYKKMKALTGLSVSIFIRHIRLEQAVRMLQEDATRPVGEVGYAVGFSDPAYFTKCFKERYGMAPSETRN